MSRVGKKSIKIPKGVEIKINVEETGNKVNIKGPKGSLELILNKSVSIEQKDDQIVFMVENQELGSDKALWGLVRTLVNNAVIGVVEGFSKELEINGVGFKVALQGKKLILNVGFSHPVEYNLPEGISAIVEKNNIKLAGIDKQLLGQVAAEIRSIKKPEPYKGKGIKYVDEQIRRKAGKVVKS
ncbi:MAG: 50S ribosomal protein L6 [Patescibacteria group bacterium]|jgi:large subunit ribosomal protein L6